jgi:hypothetical protein
VFPEALGPRALNGRIHAEHVGGGGNCFIEGRGATRSPGEGREEGPESFLVVIFIPFGTWGWGKNSYRLAPLTCGLGGGALKPRGEQSQTMPDLACLKCEL